MHPRQKRLGSAVATTSLVLLLAPALAQAQRYVDATGADAGNDCSVQAAPCATIQHAISQAVAAETVFVAAGTYAEQVTVDKGLTLSGDTTGTCPGPGAAAPVLDGGGAVGSAITIAAGVSGVTIEGFEITNYRNRTLGTGFVAGGPGSAVIAVAPTAVTGVTVQGNDIHDMGWSAVLAGNDGDVLHDGWTVDCNSISNTAGPAIELTNTINATVSNNTITGGVDVLSEIGDDTPDGVVLQTRAAIGAGLTTSGLLVQSNTIATATTAGIALRASDPTGTLAAEVTGAAISGNDVTGTLSGIELSTAGTGALVDTTDIDTNHLHANVDGILLQDTNLTGLGTHGAITATCNRIVTNTSAGIRILADVESTGVSATTNTISGNTLSGFDNASATTATGTDNFWGDASGPSGVGPGTGDAVSVRVTFTPHATTEPQCVTCSGAGGDTDGDQVCDPVDNCPADANATQDDGDADGAGDVCDACPADPLDDADADGICGDIDNCPADPNVTQDDGDADGIGDVCDACPADPDNDIDADGVCGDVDNCPADPNVTQDDGDADGVGDICDICPADPDDDIDLDGVCGDVDNCVNDANPSQLDGDADGLGDVCDACPLDPNDDADADGVCGDVDNCPAVANAGQVDGDADGLGDLCDACPIDPNNDLDADGICGDVDNCPAAANPAQVDGDTDGLGDVCDACPVDPLNDVDADGVCGDVDNCPTDANTTQDDGDADGAGDACDACPADPLDDVDADGVCGDVDNCPTDANTTQDDGDADGAGDVCDACPADPDDDIDADGVCGDVDNCPADANATQDDGDADGVGDACDSCPTDPTNDVDSDGVCGGVDNCPAVANPTQDDGDADGAGDACDVCPVDPLNDVDVDGVCGDVDNCPTDANPTQADGDADGVGDACDVCSGDPLDDVDADGVCGDVDNCPTDANATQDDADADGIGDVCDACLLDPDNDADADAICGDVDNCPALANPGQEDADGDGMGDVCDGELYVAVGGTDAPNTCRELATPCATIQYALTQANAYESVVVAAGVYQEAPQLTQPVSLVGAQAGVAPAGRTPGDAATETILDVAGIEAGIEVSSGDVVIDGLEIAGDASTNAGIRLVGGADLAGVQIQNNLIHGMSLPDPTSGTVDLAYGIHALTGTAGARNEISGLVIDDNEIFDIGLDPTSAGAGVYLHNVVGAVAGDGAMITDNFIHDMASTGPRPNRGFGVVVSWATDDALGFPDAPSSGVLTTGNAVTTAFGGVSVLAESTSVAEDAAFFTGVTMLVVNDGRLATVDELALGRHVKSDDVIEYDADGYFEAIQAAVDHSDVNAEVTATAHIFDEAVSVNTGVRLRGAKAGQDARIRTTSTGETVLTQTLSVRASGVQLDGLAIDNTVGPAIQADLVDVVGLSVRNIFIDGTPDGIVLQRALSTTIEQNLIQNVPGVGIDVGDDGGTPGSFDDVQTLAVIENNEIVNTPRGISGYMTLSRIADNVVRDFAGAGGAAISGQLSSTTVEGNLLSNYAGSPAILLVGAPNRPLTADTVFKCNTLETSLFGVRADVSQTLLTGVAFSSNNIVGNVIGVVNDADPTNLDAAFNWWGCAGGPGAPGCDTFVGNVNAVAPLAAVSDCSGCFQDADCDDGLLCNGAEVCDIGNSVCAPGTPPACDASGADAACNVGTCQEGVGCVLTPVGDGTSCDDGIACSVPDACAAGSCVGGGNGDDDADLICQDDDNCPNDPNPDQSDVDQDGEGDVCDATESFLEIDRLTIKSGFGAASGKITGKGIFAVDPQAGHVLDATGPITVSVIEGNGQVFSITFPVSECASKKGKVNCRTADKKIKAKFKPNKKAPGTYKYKIQFKKQAITGPFAEPVTVRVEHTNGLVRQGSFTGCRLSGGSTLICK